MDIYHFSSNVSQTRISVLYVTTYSETQLFLFIHRPRICLHFLVKYRDRLTVTFVVCTIFNNVTVKEQRKFVNAITQIIRED